MSSGFVGAIAFGIIGGLVGYFIETKFGITLSGMFLGLPGVASCAALGAILGLVVGVATHKR